jgi:hypothetical protein
VSAGAASADFESSLSRARGGGSPLGAKVRGQMESAMGADFSGVKIHMDNRSDQLNRSIQAKAFTTGNDIFFQQGAYNPSSAGGQALIAHELTHTIQQGAAKSQVQRLVDHTVVTYLQQQVNAETYDRYYEEQLQEAKIVDATIKYNEYMKRVETREKAPTEMQVHELKTVKKELFTLIAERAKRYTKQEKSIFKSKPSESEKVSWDTHQNLLLKMHKLVSNEGKRLQELMKEYLKVKQSNLKKLGSGNVNTVYKGEVEDFEGSGVWKEDQKEGEIGDEGAIDGAVVLSGVPSTKSNLGSRNIAMYKLDMLLGTGIIPKTVRARNGEKTGTLMAFAAGSPLTEQTKLTEEEEKAGKTKDEVANDINYQNSIVQQGLSNLQLLDSICGQVDRHGGNVIIVVDGTGKVLSIQGIDNDFAFGTKIDADPKAPLSHDRGFPKWIDSAVAKRIKEIGEADVRAALGDLLTPAEIDKTVERFNTVKTYIKQLGEADERIVKKWTPETYKAQMAAGKDKEIAAEQKMRTLKDRYAVVEAQLASLPIEAKAERAQANEEFEKIKVDYFEEFGCNVNGAQGVKSAEDFSGSYLYRHASTLEKVLNAGGRIEKGSAAMVIGKTEEERIGYDDQEMQEEPPSLLEPTRRERSNLLAPHRRVPTE